MQPALADRMALELYCTPFNETIKLLPQLGEHVEVLAGVNLPALMEACTDRDDVTVAELASQLQSIRDSDASVGTRCIPKETPLPSR